MATSKLRGLIKQDRAGPGAISQKPETRRGKSQQTNALRLIFILLLYLPRTLALGFLICHLFLSFFHLHFFPFKINLNLFKILFFGVSHTPDSSFAVIGDFFSIKFYTNAFLITFLPFSSHIFFFQLSINFFLSSSPFSKNHRIFQVLLL